MGEPIPAWPGEKVVAGRTTLFVRSTPEERGEAAVFVHGLAGSATNWTDLMGELRDVVRGHAVDLPGFGLSPPPPDGDYTVTGFARVVARFIAGLDAGPVHLFGNSLGGAVSVRVAAERPELVRSLTLISPALPDLTPRLGPIRTAVAGTPLLGPFALGQLRRLPPEQRVRASMEMIYHDPSAVHPRRVAEAVASVRERDGMPYGDRAILGALRGLIAEYFRRGPRNLWREAARVEAPTLLIHGRYDRLVDPRRAARAGRAFPHLRNVLLPHCGHVAQMECPALVAREFRSLRAEAVPSGYPGG
ncbi:alpha/beta fold hydrolase [Bailinhaonella thermotolerans]|uniref:Alpha/beta fold hydrolase n=1 Tax=Bailinhaonella thermotolerans TaxID=1070861 RepID=A0A3A4AX72_9ACTN|nr:alpha/beta fold hydrolase [Bailinhaonella thermotolerans]RJL33493.1 alpha/beta fold hydrolase [Bailinhaonella thermotolerans]